MKTLRLIPIAAALALGAAVVPSTTRPARANEEPVETVTPLGEASSVDGGDASAGDAGSDDDDLDAGADASADAGPSYPSFAAAPFPEEKSKRPTRAEWKAAERVSMGDVAPVCDVHRVREWLRIHCPNNNTLAIRLLAGSANDIAFDLDPVKADDFPQLAGGVLIFAIRRGDHRVFEWTVAAGGYKGSFSAEPMLTLEESWLPDEPSPILL